MQQPLTRTSSPPPRRLEIGLLGLGLVAVIVAIALGTSDRAPRGDAAPGKATTRAAAGAITPFDLPTCESSAAAGTDTAAHAGNPAARRAAQQGLGYLAGSTRAWQAQHSCYGCHVQAVTLEALSVGRHHQYDVGDDDLRMVLAGMLDVNGGAMRPGGLGHTSPSIGQSGKILGAAAFARYDAQVDPAVRDLLLAEARMVIELQHTDGSVPMPWSSGPVAPGGTQGTAMAIVTWKQAYERSADDQWLTAIQRAEDALRTTIAGWPEGHSDVQQMNYAIMGLRAAGVGSQEELLAGLARRLLAAQRDDGGWPLQAGGPSAALATGQTLYALRLLGMTDQDAAVARGTSWLIERQRSDGGWSDAGFGKAEAMWAVLGLVSIDVLTVSIAGLADGQHVSGTVAVEIDASDNRGRGVREVQVYVDDIPVQGACGGSLRWDWDTAALGDGKHVVEVRAINAEGKVSRRHLEVYAGDVYLTQIGSRYVGGGTEVSLRNLAAGTDTGTVSLEVFRVVDDGGAAAAGELVRRLEQRGSQGAMRFFWDGTGEGGAAQESGRYLARLSLRDDDGREIQREELVFVHDTLEAQRAAFGQIQGTLAIDGEGEAANLAVEPVDQLGRVVDRTRSTRTGNYRFRNVDADKKYQVRVDKAGFDAPAPMAAPRRAEEAQVDLVLERKK
jgi:hypothetical protein